jgi:valyl-tRNA synthetase
MMSKMSIADAAEYFGISKEAIHNRIRRGSLESVLEGDVKMVLVGAKPTVSNRSQNQKPATNFANNKYYQFLEEQNSKLQEKVEKLEGETRTLRDQKEQMLIEERIKIEQIYRDKDEQLKSILSTFQAQFMLAPKQGKKEEEEDDSALDAEIEDIPSENNTVSLNKYLKEQEFSKKKIKKIKSRFENRAQNDYRILSVGKKYYIDTTKYDYSDLLE